MNKQLLIDNLREIPDFPIKGITFFDISTLFNNAETLKELEDAFYEHYKDLGVTKVVGIESRGFVMATSLALKLHAGMVMARKPGKLPAATVKQSYKKEYGEDTIEIHADAITADDVVVIHDDILATGGTMAAVVELVKKFNPKKIYGCDVIEIDGLNGRNAFPEDLEVYSLLNLSE